jgi:site-specific DNA recombinase
MKMRTDDQERAVVYRRVSTADQVDGTSLDTQRDSCLEEIGKRGLVLADVWDFADEGRSGKSLDRPALDRLREDAHRAKFEVIVVAKADRLSRDHLDSLNLLRYFETLGVQVVTPDGDLIGKTAEQRLQRNILGVIAEFEREQILRRTRDGLRATAARGAWPGGPPPYGFHTVKSQIRSEGTRLEINEREAQVIELATVLLVDQRLSTLAVARELNARGLRPRRSPRWTHGNLRRLLLDGAYSGEWVYNRRRPGSAPDSDPIVLAIPSILTSERHSALLVALGSTSTGREATKRKKNYLLSRGRLASPCGGRFHGVFRSDRGYAQYRCSNSVPESPKRCECRRLHADDVEEHVWSVVSTMLSSPTLLLDVAGQSLQTQHATVEPDAQDLAQVQARIRSLESAMTSQVADYMREGIPAAMVKDAVDSLAAEADLLREREQRLLRRGEEARMQSAKVRSLTAMAERARSQLPSLAQTQRRAIIDLLDVKVSVLEWTSCSDCDGRGKVAGGRGGVSCARCRGIRSVPRLLVEGALTDSLFLSDASRPNLGDLPDATVRPSPSC